MWLLETSYFPRVSVSSFQSRAIIVAMSLCISVQKYFVKASSFVECSKAPWTAWLWNTQKGLAVFGEKGDLLKVGLHIPFLSHVCRLINYYIICEKIKEKKNIL